jgi:hypothetical protein
MAVRSGEISKKGETGYLNGMVKKRIPVRQLSTIYKKHYYKKKSLSTGGPHFLHSLRIQTQSNYFFQILKIITFLQIALPPRTNLQPLMGAIESGNNEAVKLDMPSRFFLYMGCVIKVLYPRKT